MFTVKCLKLFYQVFLSIQFPLTPPINVVKVTTTPTYQYTNPASKHFIVHKPGFSTSYVPAIGTLNSYLRLHVCDVPVPANLLCHVRKVPVPIPLSANPTTTSRSHALLKKFPHFHQQLMIAPRKSIFYDYNYEYKGVSLQAPFSMLITLLFHVLLNFHSTKMILVFNIFSIFNLITLTYTKCYTNLSRNLTNYINQQKYFMIWFFNCFYLCQVIKIAWIIN